MYINSSDKAVAPFFHIFLLGGVEGVGGYGRVGDRGGVGAHCVVDHFLVRMVPIFVDPQRILCVESFATFIARTGNMNVQLNVRSHVAEVVTLSVANSASPDQLVSLLLPVLQDQAADLFIEVPC